MEGFGKFDAGCCDQENPSITPYSDWDCDTFVASMKEEEDSRSLSSSSWDFEPESDIPPAILHESMSVNAGVEGPSESIHLKKNYLDQYGSYDELLKKFIQNEEELKQKDSYIEQCESQLDDVKRELKLKEDNLEQCEHQLDDVQKELKLKEDDLEYEKGQVLEMQKQKAEVRTLFTDCCYKITKFEKMLEVVANEQLKISSNEIARLTKELGSKLCETHELRGQLKVAEECVTKLECEFDSERKKIQDLEDNITLYKANETKLELQVQKLKAEMVNVREELSLEKDKLYFDIQSLSKTNEDLTSINNEYKNKAMEYAIANKKLQELYAALLKEFMHQTNSLKEEIEERKHDVEVVNKEFDMHKQIFDMLVIEKEEADAMIDTLKATIISQEDQLKRMKSNASHSLHLA